MTKDALVNGMESVASLEALALKSLPQMNSSHAMKTCVLLLLAVLLCTERAQGLRCYECLGVTSETACKAATCQYSGGVCVTQDVEVNSGIEMM
ncbi:hypothetical protein STEG23_037607 [Scotinomys teguina]